VHKNHILHTSVAPTIDENNVAQNARDIAERILKKLDYVGVLAVEFFELKNGDLIVNEIAPRVHNSGHWTQDAGCTDQFEQHIRAITGLTLGGTDPVNGETMTNLIGDDIEQIAVLAEEEDAFVHDYDKRETRKGRKMGHVNRIWGLND